MVQEQQILLKERKYHILTYGCQMNEADSEVIAELMDSMNYRKSDTPQKADCIIFNTCCVRENADLKVYGRLGEFKELKRRNPNLRIVVCGCLAQKDANNLVRKFPQVDVVLGTSRLGRLPLAMARFEETKKTIVEVASLKERAIEELSAQRKGSFSTWLPISFGCDNFCTFCIVPFVRGRLRSRTLASIVREAKQLATQGYKEITLLGQNVNEYGYDLKNGYAVDFGAILEDLDKISGIERIRFTTSHPKDFSLELVDRIFKLNHVCEHFHLPLQAGDDELLRQMRRGYTVKEYLSLVDKIRSLMPEASITTDLIVGFPGETEKQFQNTLEVVKKVRFNTAFMFTYSPREGTKAASYENQVPEKEKLERLHLLIKLQNAITEEKNKEEEGKTREVLVEGWSKKNSFKLTGRTRDNRIVVFEGITDEIGKLKDVRIKKGHLWGTEGILLKTIMGER